MREIVWAASDAGVIRLATQDEGASLVGANSESKRLKVAALQFWRPGEHMQSRNLNPNCMLR